MRSIELTFDLATEAAFLAEWAALQDAGLPNLGRHQGASNRPHLTIAAGAGVALTDGVRAVFHPQAVDPQAVDLLPLDLLPLDLRVSGLVLFPTSSGRFVLARPVVMTQALLTLHRRVLEKAPTAADLTRPDRWTPHITLARRMSADQVAQALTVLGEPPPAGRCVAARFWDGETKILTDLTG